MDEQNSKGYTLLLAQINPRALIDPEIPSTNQKRTIAKFEQTRIGPSGKFVEPSDDQSRVTSETSNKVFGRRPHPYYVVSTGPGKGAPHPTGQDVQAERLTYNPRHTRRRRRHSTRVRVHRLRQRRCCAPCFISVDDAAIRVPRSTEMLAYLLVYQ